MLRGLREERVEVHAPVRADVTDEVGGPMR
jgi:hypothetical protein